MTTQAKPNCTLITVDFKNQEIVSRRELGPNAAPFNPFKDEFFKEFTQQMASLTRDIVDMGIDHTKCAFMIGQGNNTAVLLGDGVSLADSIEMMQTASEKLARALSDEELDDDDDDDE